MFNFSQFNDQYQNWLKQMQQMQQMQSGWANQGFSAAPFGGNTFNPFGAMQQAWDAMRQMGQQQSQSMPWLHMFPTFDPTNSAAPNLRWPFGFNNLSDPSFFSANLQMMSNKFNRMQEVALQMSRLAAGAAKPEDVRSELVQLSRRLSATLAEEVNAIAGNLFTVQFINNVRAGLDLQRMMLEEQMVHSAMTPQHSDFEGYIRSCKLWQEVCDRSLGMIDVFQQFTERFGEQFANAFISKLDKEDFKAQSAEQIMDFFVQVYESEFVVFLRSDNFSRTYGQLVNSIIAVREDQQKYIDKTVEAFGLPSKREMDSTHQRQHRNTKDLREIKRWIGAQNTSDTQDAMAKMEERLASLHDLLEAQSKKIDELQKTTAKHSEPKKQPAAQPAPSVATAPAESAEPKASKAKQTADNKPKTTNPAKSAPQAARPKAVKAKTTAKGKSRIAAKPVKKPKAEQSKTGAAKKTAKARPVSTTGLQA